MKIKIRVLATVIWGLTTKNKAVEAENRAVGCSINCEEASVLRYFKIRWIMRIILRVNLKGDQWSQNLLPLML